MCKSVVHRSVTLVLVCLMALFCFYVSWAGAASKISFLEVGDPAKQKAFNEYIKVFNRIYPDIEVKYMPTDYTQSFVKIKLFVASGTPVDVSPMYNPAYGPVYVKDGTLLDLGAYLKRDEIDLDVFLPGTTGTVEQVWNGKRYGLPYGATGEVLWYNEDLFDKYGLEYPPTSWDDEKWNWNAFVEAAHKLTMDTNGDGRIDQYGLDGFQTPEIWPFLWGAEIFSKDFTEYILNEPAGIDAIQKVADLALKYRVMPTDGAYFDAGKAGMTLRGAWAMAQAKAANLPFGWNWAAMPKGTRRVSMMYIDNIYVAAGSKDKEAAWKFAKFLVTNPDAQKIWVAEGNGKLPVLKSLAPWWVKDFLPKQFPKLRGDVLVNGLKYSVYNRTAYAVYNLDIMSTIDDAIRLAISGRKSVAQALGEIKPKVDAMLKKARQ